MSVVGQPSVLNLRRSQPFSIFQPGMSASRDSIAAASRTGSFSGIEASFRGSGSPLLVVSGPTFASFRRVLELPLALGGVEVHVTGLAAVLFQELLDRRLPLERLLDRFLHRAAVVAVQLVPVGVLHV